jgi:hypothetical protein
MATYKAECLSHYYARRLRPRSAYTFGLNHVLGPPGQSRSVAVFRDELVGDSRTARPWCTDTVITRR